MHLSILTACTCTHIPMRTNVYLHTHTHTCIHIHMRTEVTSGAPSSVNPQRTKRQSASTKCENKAVSLSENACFGRDHSNIHTHPHTHTHIEGGGMNLAKVVTYQQNNQYVYAHILALPPSPPLAPRHAQHLEDIMYDRKNSFDLRISAPVHPCRYSAQAYSRALPIKLRISAPCAAPPPTLFCRVHACTLRAVACTTRWCARACTAARVRPCCRGRYLRWRVRGSQTAASSLAPRRGCSHSEDESKHECALARERAPTLESPRVCPARVLEQRDCSAPAPAPRVGALLTRLRARARARTPAPAPAPART